MELLEKQCVGCGNGYLSSVELADTSLYCTDSCKKSHSLFTNQDYLKDTEQPFTFKG